MRSLRSHLTTLAGKARAASAGWIRGGEHGALSFAQEGEDLILRRVFAGQPKGRFVDVGAHHPHRFSNTYLLYRDGWRGINLDAAPRSMEPFRSSRPGDVNLECAVSDRAGERRFFVFEESALNTFSAPLADEYVRDQWRLRETVMIPSRPLAGILAEHAAGWPSFELLSIDVEGEELSVLRSNDWERFRPRVILAEVLNATLETIAGSEVGAYLASLGYVPFAKTFNSVFWGTRDSATAAGH
jgi:FkbM family methyltransferase